MVPKMLGPAEAAHADAYVTAGVLLKTYNEDRDVAKAALLAALGDAEIGQLPDGRQVRKIETEHTARYAAAVGELIRKEYTATSLTVSALPAGAEYRKQLAAAAAVRPDEKPVKRRGAYAR